MESFNYQQFAQQFLAALTSAALPNQQQTNTWTGYKSAGSTPTASLGHGPGGLFSGPGRDRAVFSALILPVQGVQSRLPAMPSPDTNPVFQIITGQTATTGDEPTNVCDDAPYAGLTKLCETSLTFGRFQRSTRVFDITAFGARLNRGELFDYQLLNTPFADQTMLPMPAPGNIADLVNNDLVKATYELAVAWSRDFARIIWTGNPSSNNTAGGGYKEFWGFSRLINDGYRDYETQVLCAAADSTVRSFLNLRISTNATAFYNQVTDLYRRIRWIAQQTGLSPCTWAIAMPYGMFFEATEIWPWASRQPNVTLATGTTNFIDGGDMVNDRNAMRGNMETLDGQYLLIDGVRVPVIIDTAITETSIAGGAFSATLWFIPMTVLGGRQSTYFEYFDWRSQNGAMDAAKLFTGGDYYFVSDNGRFMWHRKPPTNWCAQLQSIMSPRLVCRTPYIAARLENVAYLPIEHERSWDPSNDYWVNGGRTSRTTPTIYAPSDV